MYKISNEVINIIEKTMKTWRVEMTAEERSFVEAKVQRSIFQGENEKEMETLIHAERIYSQDIGIEFGKKNAILVTKNGKRHLAVGMELPN